MRACDAYFRQTLSIHRHLLYILRNLGGLDLGVWGIDCIDFGRIFMHLWTFVTGTDSLGFEV